MLHRYVKRTSAMAILAGALILISCELTAVVILVGLGGMTLAADAFTPPLWLEIVGMMIMIAGMIGLVWYLVSKQQTLP